MLLGINLRKPTIIDASLLLFGACAVTVSLYVSLSCHDATWFERSGSLMVLFAAIVEFRNAQLQQRLNDKAAMLSGGIGGIHAPTKQPSHRQFVIVTAHTFIIVGTLVWGYGGSLPVSL